jgi:hypothetical protein
VNVIVEISGLVGVAGLKGIPAFQIVGGPAITSTTFTDQTHLLLQTSDPHAASFEVSLPGLDPAWRTSSGQYLAPGTQPFAVAMGPAPIVDFTDSSMLATNGHVIVCHTNGFPITLPADVFGQWVIVINETGNPNDITVTNGPTTWTVTPGTYGAFEGTASGWARTV